MCGFVVNTKSSTASECQFADAQALGRALQKLKDVVVKCPIYHLKDVVAAV